jgi:hypothetical protein
MEWLGEGEEGSCIRRGGGWFRGSGGCSELGAGGALGSVTRGAALGASRGAPWEAEGERG